MADCQRPGRRCSRPTPASEVNSQRPERRSPPAPRRVPPRPVKLSSWRPAESPPANRCRSAWQRPHSARRTSASATGIMALPPRGLATGKSRPSIPRGAAERGSKTASVPGVHEHRSRSVMPRSRGPNARRRWRVAHRAGQQQRSDHARPDTQRSQPSVPPLRVAYTGPGRRTRLHDRASSACCTTRGTLARRTRQPRTGRRNTKDCSHGRPRAPGVAWGWAGSSSTSRSRRRQPGRTNAVKKEFPRAQCECRTCVFCTASS